MPRRSALLGILILAACGQVETEPTASMGAPSASPTAGDARTTGWRSDLELLISERERIHPDPWHGVDRAECVAAVGAVSARVPDLDDDELLVEITRLAAMPTWAGRDGHGGIHPWGEDAYGVHLYPLRLYRFSDGLFVTDALPPHVEHIGARISHVNGRPVEDVLEAVAPLVPRDNEQQVLSHGPRQMLAAEVLHGLGFIDDPGEPVDFTFAHDGADEAVALEPIPLAAYEEWAGCHHSMSPPPRSDGPAWIRQPMVPIWWELQEDGTAHIQYNVTLPVGDIVDEVAAAVDDGSVGRVVVDMRHNPGGNNATYGPLVSLLSSPEINRPGRLYVIMGRAPSRPPAIP